MLKLCLFKDLAAINEMVRVEGSRKVGKRLLVDEGEGEEEPGNKILVTSTQPRGNNRLIHLVG